MSVSSSPNSGSVSFALDLYLCLIVRSSLGRTIYPHLDMIVSIKFSIAGIVRKASNIREKISKICL